MRSIEDLLDSLMATTEEGKLVWEQEGGQHYIARLPRHRIELWQRTDDNDGSEVIVVQLLSKADDVVDYASADQYQPAFGALSKLYLAARRSALGVADVISEVEAELMALTRVAQ